MDDVHVVAVAGSLRDESHTRTSLRHALRAAEERDATTELLDLREFDLSPLDPDAGDAGDGERFAARVRAADSVLIGTPVYHGSYSGVRSVCRALNAWVLPHQAAVPVASNAFADGAFTDDQLGDRVRTLGVRAVEYARIEPDPRTPEACENRGAGD